MKNRIIPIVMIFLCFSSSMFLEAKPKVAIMDFSSTIVSEDDAIIITEIFRSKIITSGVFDVLDRKNLKDIFAENTLSLSDFMAKSAELRKQTDRSVRLGQFNIWQRRQGSGSFQMISGKIPDLLDQQFNPIYALTDSLIFELIQKLFSPETSLNTISVG